MWRVGSIIRRRPGLPLTLAGRASKPNGTYIRNKHVRSFATTNDNVPGKDEGDNDPIDFIQNFRNSRWENPPDMELLEHEKPNLSESVDMMDPDDNDDDLYDGEGARGPTDEEYKKKQLEIRKELESRTGRLWTDPLEITDEDWMSSETFDDLPEFNPDFVSRVSKERVKLYPDGIPTLSALAQLPLPPPACPHPGIEGQAKAYAAFRKRSQYKYILEKVKVLAKPRLEPIFKLPTWDEKQDAVDELYETLEAELRSQEEILGSHPQFGEWVERALEQYLSSVQEGATPSSEVQEGKDGATKSTDTNSAEGVPVEPLVTDEEAHPIFMDCFDPKDPEAVVPKILNPLKPHTTEGPGKMVEEWEISAHKSTKRILLRQCTRSIARVLEENEASRIYVHGRKGVGKSAVLASIVASARKSGHIVLYLPDGDQLRKNGFFITPNAKREGIFDLQILSQIACQQLVDNHKTDLEGMETDQETLEKYFTDRQLQRYAEFCEVESMTPLLQLLKYAGHRRLHAPICYVLVLDRLMTQDQKPFTMVLDEFNCYFDRGHYFHMDYDEDVREPIPYDKISLFEHALGAMAMSTAEDDDDLQPPKLMKRGGIVVGVTESHAIRRKVTDGLTAFAKRQAQNDKLEIPLFEVEVPRYSDLEADHILANFEGTGVGKLRLDRGETVMNDQEVRYLKMVSGNVGQELLDATFL